MGILFNVVGSDINLMFDVFFYWYYVLGGWVFGMFFMVIDLVLAAMINKGKLVFGILIGVMVMLICVVNLVFFEGMMFVILFGNLFVFIIDYFVI